MMGTVKGRALVVGIAAYTSVTPLPAAVRKDAEDMAATLMDPAVCRYRPEAMSLLLDTDATLQGLRDALARLKSELTPEETFLLYFSGHGHRAARSAGSAEAGYLVMCDTLIDDIAGTAMEDTELLACLSALTSKRKVVILDACHAGAMGTLKSTGPTQPLGISESTIQKLGSGTGTVLLTSSRADEVSRIPYGWSNSVFTDSLLRALRGGAKDRGDGTIGVFEVFDYVATNVPLHASDQHPVLKADGLEANFPIAISPAANTAGPIPSRDRKSLSDLLATLFPQGPLHSQIWARAGGDVSLLDLGGHGAAQWFAALKLVEQGGGGLTLRQLLEEVALDYPHNEAVSGLLQGRGDK